ncbi:MAG: enoyl-CoA hydratase/isomerase family protein [Chloroflexota bacterium]
MAYQTILYEREDRLGLITLNRPERLNALSEQLVEEMMALLDEIESDDQVRVFIITGGRRADGRPCFSAGADLKERAARPELQRNAYDTVRAMMDRGSDKGLRGLCNRLETMARISMAAVDGICTAGGMELALSCDMRVASETAQMSDMHIKNLGSIGGAGVSTRLARLIGPPKAKELMFTGEPVGGQEACRIGLVNQVFPPDKLIEGAKTLGRKVAAMRPEALALGKAAMNAAMDMDIERALRFSYICQAVRPSTEGYKAFAEKRKLEF